MQKIIKECNLATAYQNDLSQNYEAKNVPHPEYSKGIFRKKYYCDVFYNLLVAQKGLCAYTEKRLCRNDFLNAINWQTGNCTKSTTKEVDGDIEHFDSSIKDNKGWLWENLFIVRTFVNRKIKLTYDIDLMFKPDAVTYSPEAYFTYDLTIHEFRAKEDLEPTLLQKVVYAIEKLGLNSESTISDRRAFIRGIQADLHYGLKTKEEVLNDIEEFPTAMLMSGILDKN